jgi:YVTN family beta-propeller protein
MTMGCRQRSYLFSTLLFAAVLGIATCARAQDFTVQGRIAVGSSPQSAAISHDGSRLFIANSGEDDISVVATRTRSIVGTIRVGHDPHGLLLSHDGQRLYALVDCGGSANCFNRAGATDDCFSQYVNIVVIDTATSQDGPMPWH